MAFIALPFLSLRVHFKFAIDSSKAVLLSFLGTSNSHGIQPSQCVLHHWRQA